MRVADAVEVVLEKRVRTAVAGTERVLKVAAMFGLGVEAARELTVVPRVRLRLGRGKVVLVTGASGGGKSTLLRLIGDALAAREGVRVVRFEGRDAGDAAAGEERRPMVDRIGGTLEEAVGYLSRAGLNDAFVMLRGPGELSDGQRFRWGLARAMAAADAAGCEGEGLVVVLADEFGSTLDRRTAAVVARQVRKWATRSGVCVVAATAHDDVLEPLGPDVLVVQEPGEGCRVMERGEGEADDGGGRS